ncbi:MAG: hypothetical protein FD174_1161 [Geobacteraceae bacterium]|nr:MAG: hypothetical protein FD174_1161 [Geobacteraceae bacterium]
MNTEVIDEAIDKYVHERMEQGKKKASERFLAYVYLKHGGDDLLEFMKKVGGLSRYYIDFLKVMENPFKGPEVAWLASMLTIAVYACILMASEESRLLGICLFSGTLANGWFLISALAKKWCDTGVMIAIYREIVEIIEKEAESKA